MVLKRKKSLKNICKSLVRPGLVISAASKADNGADDLVSLSTPMSVSSLTVSDVRPSAVTDVSIFSDAIQHNFIVFLYTLYTFLYYANPQG